MTNTYYYRGICYGKEKKQIAAHEESKTPSPLELAELKEWASKWSDKLLELESGVVGGKSAGI